MANSRLESGYHEIVYTLVYPGVLASMLYDLYQFVTGSEKYVYPGVMLLIILIYLLDYFHLFVDLKKLHSFPIWYCSLDLLIAVLFGLAFAYAKVGSLRKSEFSIVSSFMLMLVYSMFEASEQSLPWKVYLKHRWIYPGLAALGILQILLNRRVPPNGYLFLVSALYIVYIFAGWKAGTVSRAHKQAHEKSVSRIP